MIGFGVALGSTERLRRCRPVYLLLSYFLLPSGAALPTSRLRRETRNEKPETPSPTACGRDSTSNVPLYSGWGHASLQGGTGKRSVRDSGRLFQRNSVACTTGQDEQTMSRTQHFPCARTCVKEETGQEGTSLACRTLLCTLRIWCER